MRSVLYSIIKKCTQFAFFLYYRKVLLLGTENIPSNRPLLLLPNHQNALLDPLILAAYSKRKPYFLTRSDVFANSILRTFFDLLRMMPIYRIRDGRANLGKNQAIFDRCARLLVQGGSLVLFPEGDHNIQRRVRPLSKGFTRILFLALDHDPKLDIALMPVGVNYVNASGFPDAVAFYFGKPIFLQEYLQEDRSATVEQLKHVVYERLKSLTTHIEDEERYEEIAAELERVKAPYLEPGIVNEILENWGERDSDRQESSNPFWARLWDLLFILLNLPMILLWRLGPKRLVPEIEFRTTFRFLFAVVAFPLFYIGLFLILDIFLPGYVALIFVFIHGFHNWLYVKLR